MDTLDPGPEMIESLVAVFFPSLSFFPQNLPNPVRLHPHSGWPQVAPQRGAWVSGKLPGFLLIA